jgi:hypothetical protein
MSISPPPPPNASVIVTQPRLSLDGQARGSSSSGPARQFQQLLPASVIGFMRWCACRVLPSAAFRPTTPRLTFDVDVHRSSAAQMSCQRSGIQGCGPSAIDRQCTNCSSAIPGMSLTSACALSGSYTCMHGFISSVATAWAAEKKKLTILT